MKRTLLLLIFAAVCSVAAAQGPVVTVVNDTGYTFNYLYISSNNSSSWEDDVLGRKVLTDGDSFKLTLPETGVYDFKAVDTDDDDYIKWDIMVRGNTTITFTMDDFDVKAERGEPSPYVFTSSPASNATWVTVANDTGYTIYYLYISRGDDDDWFEDILGDDILEKGKQVRVMLPGPGDWDFRAVDADDDEYFRYDEPMSRGSNRVTFRISDLD